jgi:hypothetical protein
LRKLIVIQLNFVVQTKSESETLVPVGQDRLNMKACPVALAQAACQNNIGAGAIEGVDGNDLWAAQVWTQDSW